MRKQLSKKLRFEVFKRDSFTCQYCGAVPPNVVLHVDHINPVKLGGRNEIDNLVTSCSCCNIGKGANELTNVPESLADKAKKIKESELQIKGYYKAIQERRERVDQEAWVIARILDNRIIDTCRKDWLQSIKMFIDKIGYFAVLDAAELTDAKGLHSYNSAFRYFCGICWGKYRDNKNG